MKKKIIFLLVLEASLLFSGCDLDKQVTVQDGTLWNLNGRSLEIPRILEMESFNFTISDDEAEVHIKFSKRKVLQ